MLTTPQKIYLEAGIKAGTDSSVVIYFLVEGEEVNAISFTYLSDKSRDISGWFYGPGMEAFDLHCVAFKEDSVEAKAFLNGFNPKTFKPLRTYSFPKPKSKKKVRLLRSN